MPTEGFMAALTANAPMLSLTLVAFIGGVMVPFPYAMERFRGFGRVMLSKLPYAPPPGQEAGEAMEEATAEDAAGAPDPETGEGGADDPTSASANQGDGAALNSAPKSD